jgi:L-ascorbate metabolism protein UlaG (beta-lactamase superfamily)
MSDDPINLDPNLQDFYRDCGSGNGVFYMGHASVLAVFSGNRILFDPVILSKPYGDSWVFFPPQIVDSSVFEVDVVVVSHIHQDHYDVEYLKAMDGKAKIVVIGGRPSFINELKSQGLKSLMVVEPETVVEIIDGVSIFGVLHETNGIDSSAIVFNNDFCIYHGNDNYLQPKSLRKFTGVGRKIHVACIPYAYIHWYPFLMEYGLDQDEFKKLEGKRLVDMYMDDCIASVGILQPEVMIPFGANLLLDDKDVYSTINMAVNTPIEFCEYVACKAPDLAEIVKPMLAGDYCILQDARLKVFIREKLHGVAYRAQAGKFLEDRPDKLPNLAWAPIDKDEFIESLQQKVDQMEDFLNNIIRIDLTYLGELSKVEVDCMLHDVRWVDEFTEAVSYHHFKLDPIASGYWLNGGRFEEVIGMRRFTLERVPNVYSKDVLRVAGTVI